MKLNAIMIKSLVAGIDPGREFYTFCRTQIKEKYKKKSTKATYTSEINKLREYRNALTFYDIDFKFLQGYAAYLRDKKHNEDNTIWKTFKFMNTMMEDALKIGGIITESPFGRGQYGKFDRGQFKQPTRTFLTKTERPKMEALLQKALPQDILIVTAYYLLMVYCGLRYEDAMSFDYNEHIIDDERMVIMTQKKDYQLNFKLYPKLREIILFIRNNKNTGPWKRINKEFNTILKIAAGIAGIDKKLTAHTGRHSFGRLLAEKKVDKKRAQKLLGHRDEKATNIYYHILDTDLDEEIDDKLNNV